LKTEGRALCLELISQGADFLLLGLNLALVGGGALPQPRQLGPEDSFLIFYLTICGYAVIKNYEKGSSTL
jgi:hypothetical protein